MNFLDTGEGRADFNNRRKTMSYSKLLSVAWMVAFCMIAASTASAAVIIGDTSGGQIAGSSPFTLTIAHTADAGNDRVVVAGLTFESTSPPTVTNATFNGQAMTLARTDVSISGSVNNPTFLYYLLFGNSASATTGNVVFTLSGATSTNNTLIGGAVTLLGAVQGAPEAVSGNNSGATSQGSISTTLTPVTSGAAVIDIVNHSSPNLTLTPGSGQTSFFNSGTTGGSSGALGYEILGAGGNETHSWSHGVTNGRWALSSASFAAVPEPATASLGAIGALGLLARRRRRTL